MSTQSVIYIKTTINSEKVLSIFIESLPTDGKLTLNHEQSALETTTNSIVAYCMDAKEYFGDPELGKETLGFLASSVIIVRDLFIMRGDVQTAKALIKIITETNWDLAFQYWDFIILKYVDGKVTLNSKYPNDLSSLDIVMMLQQANIAFEFDNIDSF